MKKIQLAVSTAIALVGMVMVLRAGGIDQAPGSYTVDSAPTPYSTSHAIVQSRPGATEEQPPTF